jgi:hypothetical protein
MKNTKKSMLQHFSQWEQSGLNKRQYCTRENVSYQAFCKFCRRQKNQQVLRLLSQIPLEVN